MGMPLMMTVTHARSKGRKFRFTAVPEDYLLHHLTGSFAETVKWWVAQDMAPAPETVASYYIAVIRR